MLDKVLAASPLAVASFYAQDYGLIEQLQADVDESIVSTAETFIILLKLGCVLTVFYQNRIILQKIDSGMGDEILEKYLAVKQDCPGVRGCAQYLPVVLAAILMEYGATIKKAHVRQLRDLVEKMQCNENAAMVTDDTILRGAGKRQFLAALDHYQAGKPRSFVEPSCHCCGKINADIKPKGKTLKKCGGCKNEIAAAWFCDKVRMAP